MFLWRDGALVDRERRRLVQQALQNELVAGQFDRSVQWFYDPMAVTAFAGQMNEIAMAYDCMDELSKFKEAPPGIIEREQQLLALADVVFTGGRKMFESKRRYNDNCHFYGCGVDVAHFGSARNEKTQVPEDLTAIRRADAVDTPSPLNGERFLRKPSRIAPQNGSGGFPAAESGRLENRPSGFKSKNRAELAALNRYPAFNLTPHSAITPHPYSKQQLIVPRDSVRSPLRGEGGRSVLGYFGVIDERIDYELVAKLADANPNWSVVMIGPVAKVNPKEFPQRPNLHWLGGTRIQRPAGLLQRLRCLPDAVRDERAHGIHQPHEVAGVHGDGPRRREFGGAGCDFEFRFGRESRALSQRIHHALPAAGSQSRSEGD
jgi:hypothetical protein